MTPGIAFAADASIAPILAWGCGLRTIATYAIPGMFRSSTYIDEPVIRRGSSLRRTSAPTNRLRTMGALLLRRPAPIAAQALALGQTTEHSTVHDAIPGPAQPLGRRFVRTKGYSEPAPDELV